MADLGKALTFFIAETKRRGKPEKLEREYSPTITRNSIPPFRGTHSTEGVHPPFHDSRNRRQSGDPAGPVRRP